MSCSSETKCKSQPGNDGHIGKVENRPPAEIDEIQYIFVLEYVSQVSRGAAQRTSGRGNSERPLQPWSGLAQPRCRNQGSQPEHYKKQAAPGGRVEIPAMLELPESNESSYRVGDRKILQHR